MYIDDVWQCSRSSPNRDSVVVICPSAVKNLNFNIWVIFHEVVVEIFLHRAEVSTPGHTEGQQHTILCENGICPFEAN